MKTLILMLWTTTAFFLAVVPAGFGGVFPYKYFVDKLDNGLTVMTIPMESEGIVSFYTIVRTGSRDEWEPGHSGFAHLFEHMMFRGTKKFPGNVYDRIMTEIGADANAYTTDDYTCYMINFSSEDLERVMEVESDRFINLSYSEDVFKTETGAVYGEYLKGKMSPWFLLEEKLHDLAFDVHTYKHTTIGFEEDIKAMPTMYDYSLSFFRRYYRPENTVIVIAGDIERAKVVELVKKYYGHWKPGYVVPKVQQEPEQKGERFGEVKYSGKTLPIIAIAYKGDRFKPEDKRYVAAMVIEELVFGKNSELYKKLVLKEQKVEFIYPDFGVNRDPSLFAVYAMVKSAEDIEYVKAQIEEVLDDLKTSPPDERKLQDVKSNMRYSFLMRLDAPSRVTGSIARFIAITGGIGCIETFYETLRKVTSEDVCNAARFYFRPERKTVVILRGEEL